LCAVSCQCQRANERGGEEFLFSSGFHRCDFSQSIRFPQ
jgi:hypothetical protein